MMLLAFTLICSLGTTGQSHTPFTLSSIEWLIESELPTLVQLEASSGKTEALGKSCSQVMTKALSLISRNLTLGHKGLGCFA